MPRDYTSKRNSADFMLAQRLQRWLNIKTALVQSIAFSFFLVCSTCSPCSITSDHEQT